MSEKQEPFPDRLFKAFSAEEHAKNFLSGQIRFSTLAFYQGIEDKVRQDKGEGIGQLRVNGEELVVDLKRKMIRSKPGVENLHVSAAEKDRFISCFSAPEEGEVKSLPAKFGRFYVIVNNPKMLFQDIESAIDNDSGLQQNPPCLEAAYIRYDKGSYTPQQLATDEIRKLSWTQKSAEFAEEQEFRLQFWFSFSELIESPEHYTIDFNKNLDYCELLTVND